MDLELRLEYELRKHLDRVGRVRHHLTEACTIVFAQVIVTEDALKWTDEGARFPGYPAADVAASQFLWAVRRAVEALQQAARAADVEE